MKTETQQLIIKILGAIAIIALVGLLISLMYNPGADINLLLALVSVITTSIGILGGILTGTKEVPVADGDSVNEDCINTNNNDDDEKESTVTSEYIETKVEEIDGEENDASSRA